MTCMQKHAKRVFLIVMTVLVLCMTLSTPALAEDLAASTAANDILNVK